MKAGTEGNPPQSVRRVPLVWLEIGDSEAPAEGAWLSLSGGIGVPNKQSIKQQEAGMCPLLWVVSEDQRCSVGFWY